MATYRTQVLTNKDVDEVFAYMADFSNAAAWDPGVRSASRSGSGDVELGETFDLEVVMGNRVTPMTYEVIELEPPRRIVLRSETPRLVSRDTLTIRSTPAGTVLDYLAELDLKGLMRLADPLLGLAFKRIGDKATAGLREHLT